MKVLLFCGDKSRYGLSHLTPLLESEFQLLGVVFATPHRWELFREKLTGKTHAEYRKRFLGHCFRQDVKRKLTSLLKSFFLWMSSEPGKLICNELRSRNIPLFFENDVNSEAFINQVRALEPDLMFCAAYPQIFKKNLIDVPKYGCVNFHPSLLPKFRGAHPHFWTIYFGEERSGLSAHFMTENLDQGEIVAQIDYDIKGYNYHQLYEKIVEETPTLIGKVERFFLDGDKVTIKQDLSKGSYYRNNREIHHRLFWSIHSTRRIMNMIRAGGAFCFFRNKRLDIQQAISTEANRNLTNDVKVESGTIVDFEKDCIVIKAEDGCLYVERLMYDGKSMLPQKFFRKFRVRIGEKLD